MSLLFYMKMIDELFRTRRNMLVCCLLAVLFVYGYPLTNFALHIDEENGAVFGTVFNNIGIGRWGISLLHSTLLRGPVVPFFMPAISLVMLSAAAINTAKLVSDDLSSNAFLATLYIAFPQFAYQLEFLNQTESVALGLLAATLAYGCVARMAAGTIEHTARHYAFSMVLIVFSIATYQSIILLVPALCTVSVLSLLLRGVDDRRIYREIGMAVIFGAVSLIAHHVITKVVQLVLHVPPSDYFDQMIGWNHGSWSHAFQSGTGSLWKDVSGGDYFGESIYGTVFLPAVLIVLEVWRRGASPFRKALVLGLVVLGIASPYAMVLLLGMQEPPRTFVASAVIFSGFWTLGLRSIGWRQSWAVIIAACCLLYGSYHVSRLFFADTMAYRSDLLLGSRIVSTIYSRAPGYDENRTAVYFCGGYSVPNFWRKDHYDVFGGSFFSWDHGDPTRISSFMRVNGIADIVLASAAQKDSVRTALPLMPMWPNPNAVQTIKGIVIVKLGPTCGNT